MALCTNICVIPVFVWSKIIIFRLSYKKLSLALNLGVMVNIRVMVQNISGK